MARGAHISARPGGRYEIRLSPAAARAYRRCERVGAAIDGLAEEPRPRGAARLAGQDDFRIRVGDHRVVYAVDDAERLVIVARVAHRREVYRRS